MEWSIHRVWVRGHPPTPHSRTLPIDRTYDAVRGGWKRKTNPPVYDALAGEQHMRLPACQCTVCMCVCVCVCVCVCADMAVLRCTLVKGAGRFRSFTYRSSGTLPVCIGYRYVITSNVLVACNCHPGKVVSTDCGVGPKLFCCSCSHFLSGWLVDLCRAVPCHVINAIGTRVVF